MVLGGRRKILVLHSHQPLLRTYALLLERRGYEVAAVDSVIQMILRLEAEEDCFDGLLVEVSAELRENPGNFVRFIKETQAVSHPALILSGWGSHDLMRVAVAEGIAAIIQPADTQEFLGRLSVLLNETAPRFTDDESA
jgi:DNA-binding response OmpR family regulator